MNRRLAMTVPLLALLCLSIGAQVSALTVKIDVEVGDQYLYKITAYWSSPRISATPPSDLLELNGTALYNMTILYVESGNVTSNDVWSFTNGTEKNSFVVQSLITGQSFVMNGLVAPILADLGPGDLIHPEADDFIKINKTITIDYGGSRRDANVIAFDTQLQDANGNNVGSSNSTYIYDKSTGALVERRDDTEENRETTSVVMTLQQTNRWTISTVRITETTPPGSVQPSSTNIPIFVIVSVGVAVLALIVAAAVISNQRTKKAKRIKRFRRH
jgi:hypothetical protein